MESKNKENKGFKLSLIILLTIIAIALINIMIILLLNSGKNNGASLLEFGNQTEKIFQKEYDAEDITSINAVFASSKVKIKESESTDKINVTAYGNKNDKITEEIKDQELKFSKENSALPIFTVLYWCNEEIIIEVPENSEQDIKVKTSSGDIALSDMEKHNVNLESSSGNIVCGNINNGEIKATSGNIEIGKVKKINAKTSSGDIDLGRVDAFCQISATSGDVEIDILNITENSTISAKSGDVSVDRTNEIYVEGKATSGEIDIKNIDRKSEVQLDIETTSGDIEVNT